MLHDSRADDGRKTIDRIAGVCNVKRLTHEATWITSDVIIIYDLIIIRTDEGERSTMGELKQGDGCNKGARSRYVRRRSETATPPPVVCGRGTRHCRENVVVLHHED
ncbi:hypothetical protein EVAR_19152_1 [Eumeta japonica]|uniref:Uncharacterized protein n=1 Tax=Eumeta variegata TaxID=151549 RepID=A0A4C1VQF2_EUMVA|nr:hypothetical protein EVAR_19152_1 [Eumeta japonica]